MYGVDDEDCPNLKKVVGGDADLVFVELMGWGVKYAFCKEARTEFRGLL